MARARQPLPVTGSQLAEVGRLHLRIVEQGSAPCRPARSHRSGARSRGRRRTAPCWRSAPRRRSSCPADFDRAVRKRVDLDLLPSQPLCIPDDQPPGREDSTVPEGLVGGDGLLPVDEQFLDVTRNGNLLDQGPRCDSGSLHECPPRRINQLLQPSGAGPGTHRCLRPRTHVVRPAADSAVSHQMAVDELTPRQTMPFGITAHEQGGPRSSRQREARAGRCPAICRYGRWPSQLRRGRPHQDLRAACRTSG